MAGDDYVFFKPKDQKVYFFECSTEEETLVAENFDLFVNIINKEN